MSGPFLVDDHLCALPLNVFSATICRFRRFCHRKEPSRSVLSCCFLGRPRLGQMLNLFLFALIQTRTSTLPTIDATSRKTVMAVLGRPPVDEAAIALEIENAFVSPPISVSYLLPLLTSACSRDYAAAQQPNWSPTGSPTPTTDPLTPPASPAAASSTTPAVTSSPSLPCDAPSLPPPPHHPSPPAHQNARTVLGQARVPPRRSVASRVLPPSVGSPSPQRTADLPPSPRPRHLLPPAPHLAFQQDRAPGTTLKEAGSSASLSRLPRCAIRTPRPCPCGSRPQIGMPFRR